MKTAVRLFTAGLIFLVAGCGQQTSQSVTREADPQIVFFNLTSDAAEDPHPMTMAFQLAGHALDDGRKVVLFFNVRAVNVPTTAFPAKLAFKDKPLKDMLAGLLDRGAAAHVCPHCLKALGVDATKLVAGAQVTTREALFANIGSGTVVFTY